MFFYAKKKYDYFIGLHTETAVSIFMSLNLGLKKVPHAFLKILCCLFCASKRNKPRKNLEYEVEHYKLYLQKMELRNCDRGEAVPEE